MLQVYHQGTSQFKGVSWAERSKKWRAQLWFGNKVPLLLPALGACSPQPPMLGPRRTRTTHWLPMSSCIPTASFSPLHVAIRSCLDLALVLMSGVC